MFRGKTQFLSCFQSCHNHLRRLGDVQQKIKNSYYMMHGDVLLKSSTLSQLADDAADTEGDRLAFISIQQGISKTFSEFQKEVRKLASGFVSLGLSRGDTVAICCPNSYEWPLTQFATAKAGLILVNINPAYKAQELEYCLKKVQSCGHLGYTEISKFL